MRLVFWQGVFSMHHSAYLRALAARGHECLCVVDGKVEAFPERAKMGWQDPDPGQVRLIVRPDQETLSALLEDTSQQTIHVLGGIRSTRVVEIAWDYCLAHPRRFGILSERADLRGWKGLLRRAYYGWVGRRYGNRPQFALALGEIGARWFVDRGFPRERVFPIAYATESQFLDIPPPPRADSPFQLVYLGSLFHWKGPDLLLSALARLADHCWQLRVMGDGPLRTELEDFVRKRQWGDRVAFLGYLPYDEAMRRLAGTDLLVLPSRYDGWGAVVNEALMRGIPVVCSDQCGACDLVREAWRGEVYPYNDVDALAQAIGRRLAAGPPDARARQRIQDWSRCVDGDSVADYSLAVLNHVYGNAPRPAPPWSTEARRREPPDQDGVPVLADSSSRHSWRSGHERIDRAFVRGETP